MNKIVAGALAGFAATAPMSVLMLGWHRHLPWRERYSLPPREITEEVTKFVGAHHMLDDEAHSAVTAAAHFGYGAAAGALYAPLAEKVPAPPAIKGIAFGLIVWSVSYLGLLPTVNVLTSATEHPPRRNALMIAAHVVWGACLGLLTERWAEES